MAPTPVDVPPTALEFLNRLFPVEAGISNDPNDHGGLTNMGITKPFLSQYLGRPATNDDITSLTRETATQAYVVLLYNKYNIDDIAAIDKDVAYFLFDWLVNSGTSVAALFQNIFGAVPDGKYGPATIAAIKHEIDREGNIHVRQELCDYRMHKYISICKHDTTQIEFLSGWYDRVIAQRP